MVLDVTLPGMDGLEVEQIPGDDRLVDVPVVFVMGKGRQEDGVAGFEAQVDESMAKPFSPIEPRVRIE